MVVVYHLTGNRLKGGFIGVDVFFVISGFLVTGIIFRQIQDRTFKFSDFFIRRIYRLFPVFAAVVVATAVSVYFFLKPTLFDQFGTALQYSSVGLANLSFLNASSDYFAQSGVQENPLLHLWSLAIEEQFYLGFPLLLYVATIFLYRKVGDVEKKVFYLLSALVTLSLACSLYLFFTDKNASFFLFYSRAWELLAGSLLAISYKKIPTVKNSYLNDLLWLSSISGLFLCAFTFKHESFPGISAVWPVLLTVLAIYSGPNLKSHFKFLLINRFSIFIGLISYSLYMWHWPLIAFARSGLTPFWGIPRPTTGVLLILILTVSIASWRFIEMPFRSKRNKLAGFSALIVGIFIFQFAGAQLKKANQPGAFVQQTFLPSDLFQLVPLPQNVPYKVWQTHFADKDLINSGKGGKAIGVPNQNPETLIIGDSHAAMWGDGIDALFKAKGLSAVLIATESCSFLFDYNRKDNPNCYALNKARENYIRISPNIKKVILISSWKLYDAYDFLNTGNTSSESNLYKALKYTIDELNKLNKEVYVVKQIVPLLDDPYKVIGESAHLTEKNEVQGYLYATFLKLPEIASVYDVMNKIQTETKVTILDPNKVRCATGQCLDTFNKKLLIHDNDHLNSYGSQTLAADVFLTIIP